MENMKASILPNVELMAKAQTKLKSIGIDVNAVINNILQKIIEEDFTANEIESLSKPTKKTNTPGYLPNTPQHVKEYFDLLPKEEIERRINLAKTKGPRSESLGIFEGMIWMSDDFDDPLDEMKDYM